MTSFATFCRRLPWLNVAAGLLLVLLQRTPALRVLVQAKDYVLAARAGELLRAAFTAATLGAMHSRAGATTFTPSQPNPVRGTVGQPLNYGFTYTGTPSSPATFSFSGTLPPGLRFEPAPLGSTIRSGTPAIVGTPTQAGTFTITVQGFNAEGLTNNVQQQIVFQITAGASTAPEITTQPQSQTVNVGANVTFSVTATGSPPPTFQWWKSGSPILGATNATLTISGVQAGDAGRYSVVVANDAGARNSNEATLTVNTPGGGGAAPQITVQPLSVTAATGSTAALMVAASGNVTRYQWSRNGTAIAGANDATLLLPNVSVAQAGDYRVTVEGGSQSVASETATLSVTPGESRLANLSVRTTLGANQGLIVGFATNGQKSVLLRGIGPTLGTFGVSGAYTDPRLAMFDGGGAQVAENDNWNASLAAAFTAVGAFPLAANSRDAALQMEIAGSRTAQLSGPNSGVVLVEVYDSGTGNAVRLVNVSARNVVGTGDNILIAGFVVSGAVGKTLLIRAVGPRLADLGVSGVLADPKLEIFDGGRKIVENDNWTAAVGNVFGSVGAFGLTANSRDAALIVTLPPGSGYTAQVSGIAGGTGEALVEVYEVP